MALLLNLDRILYVYRNTPRPNLDSRPGLPTIEENNSRAGQSN